MLLRLLPALFALLLAILILVPRATLLAFPVTGGSRLAHRLAVSRVWMACLHAQTVGLKPRGQCWKFGAKPLRKLVIRRPDGDVECSPAIRQSEIYSGVIGDQRQADLASRNRSLIRRLGLGRLGTRVGLGHGWLRVGPSAGGDGLRRESTRRLRV